MKKNKAISRRDFLGSGSLLTLASMAKFSGASLALVAETASAAFVERRPFKALDAFEARQLEAIAARIIPTTDTPGAREAGVVYFLDAAVDSPLASAMELIRADLPQFNELALASGANTESFADLPAEAQDILLTDAEPTAFFQAMLFMTKAGFFGMSKYGGNRDHLSWDLIGYDAHHGAWQYPFGHYDAEIHGDEEPGHG